MSSSETTRTTIIEDIEVLTKLVKSIFEKLDDTNCKCESKVYQISREAQTIESTKNTPQNLPSSNKLIEMKKNEENLKTSNGTTNEKNEQIIVQQKPTINKPFFKKTKLDQKQNEKIDIQHSENINNKLINDQPLCFCSPIEEYYRKHGYSYVYHTGRILVINCPNDTE